MGRWIGLGVAVLLGALVPAGPAAGQVPPADLRIQLKWTHQFQFAGYYAALDQGYFRDAGLNVELVEGGPALNPTDEVLAGRAEFGIGTSGLLTSRSRGRPVVAVAAIFQHSPFILLTRYDPAIRTPRDLRSRTVMVEPYAEELVAYLHAEGVGLDTLQVIEHSGDPLDLINGSATAMTAYTTTEPFILGEAGIPYRIFDPKLAGIDFYGDTLFTTEAFAARHAPVVAALREAVIEGWRYALRHPEATVDLILRDYQPTLSREHLQFEAAEIRRLLIPDMVEIGYMNAERWERIAEAFRVAGLLEQEVDLRTFLFAPPQRADWTWAYLAGLAGALLILISSAILWKFYALNRHLQAEIRARRLLELDLRQRAVTDPGTGVLNRRGLLAAVGHALAQPAHGGRPGAGPGSAAGLLMLDLDRFKAINDTYGHRVGDRVLEDFAAVCRETLREGDIVGRLGGEEFMIALPDTDPAACCALAERLRGQVAARRVPLDDGRTVSYTVSIGVAVQRPGEGFDALMTRADAALYRAKREGRNRVSGGEQPPAADSGTAGEVPAALTP